MQLKRGRRRLEPNATVDPRSLRSLSQKAPLGFPHPSRTGQSNANPLTRGRVEDTKQRTTTTRNTTANATPTIHQQPTAKHRRLAMDMHACCCPPWPVQCGGTFFTERTLRVSHSPGANPADLAPTGLITQFADSGRKTTYSYNHSSAEHCSRLCTRRGRSLPSTTAALLPRSLVLRVLAHVSEPAILDLVQQGQ
jgi:hypothetical protein